MPSIVIGNPVASGAQPLIVGNPFSGDSHPITGLYLRLDRSASGSVYVGIQQSGLVTLNSGGMFLSGNTSGFLDGMQIPPGQDYFIPKGALNYYSSGYWPVFVHHDAECSGQARLYYEWQF